MTSPNDDDPREQPTHPTPPPSSGGGSAGRASPDADPDALTAEPTSGDFFSFSKPPRRETPASIGKYEILRLLGRGGMGEVYLARSSEGAFEQLVAIKLAIPKDGDVERSTRFERERQVLYGLKHPNIARVLDGGVTDDGVAYFVMEYIEGRPIDEYCRGERLNTRERVELFLKVCEAVSYCHRHLIVHRDIKPANILVGRDGEPKLLDFGIAKLLSPELMPNLDATADPHGPMTIAYAGPEQVSGGLVTPATDIYALGVLLYQLLTGRMPYALRQAAFDRMVHAICNEKPEPPSTAITKPHESFTPGKPPTTRSIEDEAQERGEDPARLRRRLAGDLDDIVMVCLAKKPSLRFQSAEDLKRDLENHLARRAVEARRQRRSVNWRLYAAGRFASRNRGLVGSATAAVLALVVGLGIALWQWTEAAQQREIAEANADRVRAISGDILDSLYAEVARLPGARAAQAALLTDGAEVLRSADGAGFDTPDDVVRRADRFRMLGDIAAGVRIAGVGDLGLAREFYGDATELLDQVNAEQHEGLPAVRALTLIGLADADLESGETRRAIERYRMALDLTAPESQQPELVGRELEAFCKAAVSLAYAAHRLGEFDEQTHEPAVRRSIAMARSARLAGDPGASELLAYASHNLGELYADLGRPNEAEAMLEEAVRLREQSINDRPWDGWNRRLYAISNTARVSFVDLRSGEPPRERTLESLRDAADELRLLLAADPNDQAAARQLAGVGATAARVGLADESMLEDAARLVLAVKPTLKAASRQPPPDRHVERLNYAMWAYFDSVRILSDRLIQQSGVDLEYAAHWNDASIAAIDLALERLSRQAAEATPADRETTAQILSGTIDNLYVTAFWLCKSENDFDIDCSRLTDAARRLETAVDARMQDFPDSFQSREQRFETIFRYVIENGG